MFCEQTSGTSTEYDEGIDKNQSFLNGIDGISTANGDGGINSIDPMRLIRDPFANCGPVYPWDFVRCPWCSTKQNVLVEILPAPPKCFSCANIRRFVYWPTLSGGQIGASPAKVDAHPRPPIIVIKLSQTPIHKLSQYVEAVWLRSRTMN